jgi:hypothetical protein
MGMACNVLILPTPVVSLFQRGIYTVLQALAAYDEALQNSLLTVVHVDADKTEALLLLGQQKIQLQQLMQAPYGAYPEWVYEVGFNPALGGGFRFFLIHIERIIELYFAMEYLVHRLNKEALPQELLEAVIKVMHFNHEGMLMLMHYFKHHQWQDTSSDLMSDMFDLQKALANAVPAHLGLLDISSDYVMLTDLVRNIKDIRELLLQLIESLPKASNA